MNRQRLLLFDLDGTLLGPDRRIRPANLVALHEAMERGLLVGLATGRSPLSAQGYLEKLAPNGPSILLNGCLLWDNGPVAQRTLPHGDAVRLVEATIELGVHANVYIAGELFVAHRGELSLASEAKDGVSHTEVADLVAHVRDHDAPFKLLCIHESGDFTALIERFREVVESDCTIVQSEPTYLEVLPPGVNKAAMLDEVERLYGVAPIDVVAFGDELNDLELLRAAGTAVAMGNANPEIVRYADHQIGPNDSDAIAMFVRGLLQQFKL